MEIKKFKVNDIFYSLQGEGRWAGTAAIFIRFSKCNIHCPFCDTDFASYTEMTEMEIMDELKKYPKCKFIVLTGGEPTLQLTPHLLDLFHDEGYYVAMETNGTNPVIDGVDWITCSPKIAYVKKAVVRLYRADEVKVVYDGIHEVSAYGIKTSNLYVQPCDVEDEVKNREIMDATVEFIKKNPQWKMSLQQQKVLNVK